MKIDLSPRFQELVNKQIEIISTARYPGDAARWFNGLTEKISILDTFPESGRLSRVPDLAANGIREIVYGTFIAYYVIEGDLCRLISLRRAGMNIESMRDL